MKVYLAGENDKDKIIPAVQSGKEAIQKYLKCDIPAACRYEEVTNYKPYILESFYYADETTEKMIPHYGDLLLDSGAFTFMGGFSFTENKDKRVDFVEYIERYAEFINRNNVDKFFELDVDSVVGYEEVLKYRKRLEKLTNRQSIPVWHSNRGREEFLKSCDEYPYVALGGIVGGEWKAKAAKCIPWFIQEAHKRKAKIHALGFTDIPKLKQYHFDSVDSTRWACGNRFGLIFRLVNGDMVVTEKPKGKKLANSKTAAVFNYVEWLKFQQYAEAHL